MKKELLTLLTVAGSALLVGCAATDTSRTEYNMPTSQLSYTPLTSPVELVKWSQDFPTVRVMEVYRFFAPTEVDEPLDTLPTFSENLPPGSVFVEAAGAEAEPRAYRVIRHAPHQR